MRKLAVFTLIFTFYACEEAKNRSDKISVDDKVKNIEVIDTQDIALSINNVAKTDDLIQYKKNLDSDSNQTGILSLNLYFLSKNFPNGMEICDLDTQVKFRVFLD